MHHNNLVGHSIHSGDVVDWEFLSNKGLAQYDPLHKGVTFRLGGVEREMSLLELGCVTPPNLSCSGILNIRRRYFIDQ
ncbi:hypothetical protein Tco_1397438 [Tanacetum coccineum]